jgi:hypothetical protein
MAIDENDPRLKDMLRAIELGDTLEDLDDPEEYEDQGGINSLKRKTPSIKMASEPEDEFELELGTVIKEYNDLKEQGIIRDISIEEYIDKYLSKKRKSPNMQMAGMGNVMKLFETPYGFDRDGFEENYIQFMDYKDGGGELGLYDFTLQGMGMVKKDTPSDRSMAMGGGMMRMGYAGGTEDIVEPSESMKKDTTTYPLGQDPQFDDKLIYRPDPKDSKELKRLKELMERRKKEKKKLAVGGIAGVL